MFLQDVIFFKMIILIFLIHRLEIIYFYSIKGHAKIVSKVIFEKMALIVSIRDKIVALILPLYDVEVFIGFKLINFKI